MTRELITQMLEALEVINMLDADINFLNTNAQEEMLDAAITAAREYLAAEQAPQPTYGWLIACDDAMITTHLGVAELSHSYEYAKKALNELIDWHIAVATDPAINGGLSLQPQPADLTDSEIWELASDWFDADAQYDGVIGFSHAVLAAQKGKA